MHLQRFLSILVLKYSNSYSTAKQQIWRAGELEEHWKRPELTWIDPTGLAKDNTVTLEQSTAEKVLS